MQYIYGSVMHSISNAMVTFSSLDLKIKCSTFNVSGFDLNVIPNFFVQMNK